MSSSGAALQVMELVRAMAVAWKNLAYPPGHPALAKSLGAVERALSVLRGPAGEVVLGIGTRGLVYGSTEIQSLTAEKLAQALYERGVAVVRFGSETTTQDIEIFLRTLARGSRGPRRALWDDLTAAGVVNINLQRVDYSAVRLTETLAEPDEPSERSLWDDIVHALLENLKLSSGGGSPKESLADELARMISQYATDDDAIYESGATFGARMPQRASAEAIHRFLERTVGEHITRSTGFRRQHSLEQAVQLIRELPEPYRGTILRSVLNALASDDTAEALLRDFAAELPGDEVLETLRYLAATGKLSSHALTLLQSLGTVETGAKTVAEGSIAADLVELLAEDDVHRFNPREHHDLLGAISLQIPHVPPEAIGSIEQLGMRSEDASELLPQFTMVLLDLLLDSARTHSPAAVLTRLESVFRVHVTAGDLGHAVTFVKELQELAASAGTTELRVAIDESLARIAMGDAIQAIVDSVHATSGETSPQIQRLAELLGTAAYRPLLQRLADEPNRSRRRRVFDFLTSLGPAIVPDATHFLRDERWFVVRNMVVLLRAVQDRASLPEIAKLAEHPDLRVRMEAIKSLHIFNVAVPSSVLQNLFNDPDPKVTEAAVTLASSQKMKEAVEPLLRILDGNDVFGARRILRVKAIRALGEIGDQRALTHIDRFLKPSVLPWPSREERYAAWESLRNYPPQAVGSWPERGLRSSDPHVRAISAKLLRD